MIDFKCIKRCLLGKPEEVNIEDSMGDVKFEKDVVADCLSFWSKRRRIR